MKPLGRIVGVLAALAALGVGLWQWREEGSLAPDGRSKVQKTKIAGRTTYFCAGWQQKY